MSIIEDIFGRQIIDSRGNPTVEVDVTLEDGTLGRAAVPSGASTGAHEAVERRDGDTARYGGKGVREAVRSVNQEILDTLSGFDAREQVTIDTTLADLDGTANKSRLGANAILGTSLAVAKAAADEAGVPFYRHLGGMAARTLPTPMMNILNGGAHADNALDFQEFMIVPVGAPDMAEAVRWGAEVTAALKADLKRDGHGVNVGDEGGFAPALKSTEEALDRLENAIRSHLPESEHHFDDDDLTNRSSRFLAAEMIREKITRQLGDELPYTMAVEIETFEQEGKTLHINGLILVERQGQKKIVIGDKGSRLRQIGQEARLDMESLFGSKVMLRLWVKVRKGWADDERALRSLGYGDQGR